MDAIGHTGSVGVRGSSPLSLNPWMGDFVLLRG
jgi:hypothetical protein